MCYNELKIVMETVGKQMSFVPLHTFSAYSLLSSTAGPEELVSDAKRKGYHALALTDRNVLYGVIPFYKACKKHGIKPVIGLTVDVMGSEDGEQSFPLILLAKNLTGYKNLIKISSSILTKSPGGIPVRWLKHYSSGLFAVSPGPEGEITQLLLKNEPEKAAERIEFYQNIFDPGSFYLSVQPFTFPENEMLAEHVIRLGRQLNVPIVMTNKVCFLNKEDYETWKCMQAIKKNVPLESIEENKWEKEYYLRAKNELSESGRFTAAVENSGKIAAACNVEIPFHGQILPKYPLKDQTSDEYLTEICRKGLAKRGRHKESTYIKRLEYELSVIKRMRFSDYFLIVWDFVRFAKKNGITVGPGRGSAAGSLVAYCLGITDVDPVKYDLLFERFLNPERVSMPDIDIDFPDHRRDEVIEYVIKKYGRNRVAQIITFGTFQAKQALRDVARVFGFSSKELGDLSKAVPNKHGITLGQALKDSGQLKQLLQTEKYKKVFHIACKIEGLPRHTSTHAAGVVISDGPLIERVPVQSGSNETLLTQFPMEVLEEIGLLKMDFLGLRNLSLMESILDEIKINENQTVRLKDIPMDDEKTFRLLQEGRTAGIFQLESDGMRDVLVRLRPTEFEDIVAVIALYRPGPMANIPKYILRKHGKEKVVYPHEDLKSILEKTYGVIVYQEQIMQIASKMAGFTLGEADLLRRAVSKKNRDVLERERLHFVRGALKNGYSEKTVNEIYDLILRFADYGFNRSHAVAYSKISYQLAYLKAHYPLYFMAALLTSVIGNEEKTAEYVRELRNLGYTLKGPSVNHSHYHYTVENGSVRMSLAAVKGVGYQALKEIFRAREEKPFTDLFDFCLRVSQKVINRKVMEHLIYAGCFDEFGFDRAVLLATLDAAIDHARLLKSGNGQLDLLFTEDLGIKPKYTDAGPIPLADKLEREKEVLGLFISEHPASVYRNDFRLFQTVWLSDLKTERRSCNVGVYIEDVRKIRTKKGESMAFLTINDESGEMPAVVFPDVYRKSLPLLKKGEVVLLTGYLEMRNRGKQFVVQKIKGIRELKEEISICLFIKITEEKHTGPDLRTLKTILVNNKGTSPVILYYEKTGRTIQLSYRHWINPDERVIGKIKELFGKENVVLKKWT